MARTFYGWLYEHGEIDAATLLAIRGTRPPAGSSARPCPRPYRQSELRELRSTLAARWPRLTDDQAARAVARWRDGRSPYTRIRAHAIGLQHTRRMLGIDSLDAMLPYAALVTGTTEDAMHHVEPRVTAALTATG